MRWILVGLIFGAACSSPPTPPASETTAPAEARILARLPLTVSGGTVGTVMAVARCGSSLYVGDSDARIHQVDMGTGQLATPLGDGTVLPMALAADCDRNRVWAISPLPRGRGLRALAFDTSTGEQAKEIPISSPCFPTAAVVSADTLFVGGQCIAGEVGERYVPPAAADYYSDKRIGVRVSVTTGEAQEGLVPYESVCHGAGACVGGSIDAAGEHWIASVRAASRFGIYARDGALKRTIPVSSPAFVSDGSQLPANAMSEQSVRWSTRNSLIHQVYAIAGRLVVVHYRLRVSTGWKMGGAERPQFDAKMNVLTSDGMPLQVDIALPELPVGTDGEALYVVDYGPAGRQGAHESVTVLRVAVPVS